MLIIYLQSRFIVSMYCSVQSQTLSYSMSALQALCVVIQYNAGVQYSLVGMHCSVDLQCQHAILYMYCTVQVCDLGHCQEVHKIQYSSADLYNTHSCMQSYIWSVQRQRLWQRHVVVECAIVQTVVESCCIVHMLCNVGTESVFYEHVRNEGMIVSTYLDPIICI